MVHHADLGNGFQQGLALHLVRPVGVHDHQNGVTVAEQQGLLTGNKGILIFRYLANLGNQLFCRIVVQVQNDLELPALFPAQTADAHGGPHGVQVRIFVAHDEHLTALADEFHNGVGGHTGADLAAVVGFSCPATVKAEIVAVLDDCLVAAPAQGHFNGQGSEPVALVKGCSVHAQAQRNGCSQPGGTGDLMNLLQQGEFILNGPVQVPTLKEKQIAAPLQPAQQTVVLLRPAGDGAVDLRIQGGNGPFGEVFRQFLVVVD